MDLPNWAKPLVSEYPICESCHWPMNPESDGSAHICRMTSCMSPWAVSNVHQIEQHQKRAEMGGEVHIEGAFSRPSLVEHEVRKAISKILPDDDRFCRPIVIAEFCAKNDLFLLIALPDKNNGLTSFTRHRIVLEDGKELAKILRVAKKAANLIAS